VIASYFLHSPINPLLYHVIPSQLTINRYFIPIYSKLTYLSNLAENSLPSRNECGKKVVPINENAIDAVGKLDPSSTAK
jgi:hypothetical protein